MLHRFLDTTSSRNKVSLEYPPTNTILVLYTNNKGGNSCKIDIRYKKTKNSKSAIDTQRIDSALNLWSMDDDKPLFQYSWHNKTYRKLLVEILPNVF